MEKRVHCEKAFLASDPNIADDRFVSSAVIRAEDAIKVGLSFYNGRGSMLLSVDVPITQPEPSNAARMGFDNQAATQALTMLMTIQGVIQKTIAHLTQELEVVGSHEVSSDSRGA